MTHAINGWRPRLMMIDGEFAPMPTFEDKLTLVRIGKKRFIVKRQWGAALVTYKCSYPEAQRRFALLIVTRRLTR